MLAAVRRIEATDGAIGALVNNAGYGEYGPVEEITMDALRRQFETNVFGLVRLTQLVLPGMRAQRSGRIVNISSMGGRLTLPGGGVYHASKYAVESLSDALRFELRGFGIAVILIEPGPVLSAFAEEATAPPDGTGPYAAFRLGVARRNAASYEQPAARTTIRPDDVAVVIARVIDSPRPKARYLVGGVSRLLVGAHRVLPDDVWDLLMRTLYPTPRASP